MNQTHLDKNWDKFFQDCGMVMKGHFLLSSGLLTDTYVQCAQLFLDAKNAQAACSALWNKCQDKFPEIDCVISAAIGGIIVGYELSRAAGLPSMFLERKEGKFTLSRGFKIKPDAKILLVEDVITTGKSALECLDYLKEKNANVLAIACLMDRRQDQDNLPLPLISLAKSHIKTWTKDSIPEHLKETEPQKMGSRPNLKPI